MSRYRHIFFDLDHTLWDFRANSRATLAELFVDLDLAGAGVSGPEAFINGYEEINDALWGRYAAGRLPKAVLRVLRFRNTLLLFGVKDEGLAKLLGEEYVDRCPRRKGLMPGAIPLLEDLRPKYGLHVITNGFDEVQRIKLKSSGLDAFMDVVVTSEMAGVKKPDSRIFGHAMKAAGSTLEQGLMVGDNIKADMEGARNTGMDHAHFVENGSPDEQATFRIHTLDELRPILL